MTELTYLCDGYDSVSGPGYADFANLSAAEFMQ